ncbi:hypothetical protein [Brucella oryzae]|uniref:Lipoprotein n=1 Tax=Brucella oryzae TaxID=335286 RepID=A0A2S7IW34_9HYPH|nr:hypothetical protein [Brucella oryzae]PQA72227.1 hypothetical protein C3731_17670 [Brucella oryzae]
MRFALFFMLMCGTAQACNEDLVRVNDWSIRPVDKENSTISLEFASKSEKAIRMIDASAVFEDKLGEIILSFNLDRDVSLKPGLAETTNRRLWPDPKYDRLSKLAKDDIKAYVCVRGLVYEDGSKETFK